MNTEISDKNYLQEHFLQSYLYSGQKEVLEKAGEVIDLTVWNSWHRAVLIETDVRFFDLEEDLLSAEINKELRRPFFYLNLNAHQSVLLFQDVYCDYQLVANHIYTFLKRLYRARFYLAVSRGFEGVEYLPEILDQLGREMDYKYYNPEKHIFICEEEYLKLAMGEVQDYQIMKMISEDIVRRDMDHVWKHFNRLKGKYHDNSRYSAMYTKFVFSNVIQALYQEKGFADEKNMEQEVERLYTCKNITDILDVTEENIRAYEKFLKKSMGDTKKKASEVKDYIRIHFGEEIGAEFLAERFGLSAGFLCFIFKKENGVNLHHFIWQVRMEKAAEMLRDTDKDIAQISADTGFINVSYFERSFCIYHGRSPADVRAEG